jgi:hypothetical protein
MEKEEKPIKKQKILIIENDLKIAEAIKVFFEKLIYFNAYYVLGGEIKTMKILHEDHDFSLIIFDEERFNASIKDKSILKKFIEKIKERENKGAVVFSFFDDKMFRINHRQIEFIREQRHLMH